MNNSNKNLNLNTPGKMKSLFIDEEDEDKANLSHSKNEDKMVSAHDSSSEENNHHHINHRPIYNKNYDNSNKNYNNNNNYYKKYEEGDIRESNFDSAKKNKHKNYLGIDKDKNADVSTAEKEKTKERDNRNVKFHPFDEFKNDKPMSNKHSDKVSERLSEKLSGKLSDKVDLNDIQIKTDKYKKIPLHTIPLFEPRLKVPNEECHGKACKTIQTISSKEGKEILDKRKSLLQSRTIFSFLEEGTSSFNQRKNKIVQYPNRNFDIKSDANIIQIEKMFFDICSDIDFKKINEKLGKCLLNPLIDKIPIGGIADINTYKLVSGMNNSQNLLSEEDRRDIENIRMIYSDGNGFYRAVMFAFLELLILNKNVNELTRFAFDFNNIIGKPLKGRNIQINKNEFLAIIYIIIEFLNKNKIEEAFSCFIKSYFLFECFEIGLIKYLRLALADYFYMNINEVHENFIVAISNVFPYSYVNNNRKH